MHGNTNVKSYVCDFHSSGEMKKAHHESLLSSDTDMQQTVCETFCYQSKKFWVKCAQKLLPQRVSYVRVHGGFMIVPK